MLRALIRASVLVYIITTCSADVTFAVAVLWSSQFIITVILLRLAFQPAFVLIAENTA